MIRKMVQDLIDTPIGNPNLEHYWEQKMTVYFQKTVENDKQVRFGCAHIPVKGEYIWLHGSPVEETCQPWRCFL